MALTEGRKQTQRLPLDTRIKRAILLGVRLHTRGGEPTTKTDYSKSVSIDGMMLAAWTAGPRANWGPDQLPGLKWEKGQDTSRVARRTDDLQDGGKIQGHNYIKGGDKN